jgi:alkane 1-monooxygenase
MALGPLRYCGPFFFAASIPALFYGLGPFCPILTIVALLLALLGAELISERSDVIAPADRPAAFGLLPYFYIPVQLALIGWAVVHAAQISVASFLALCLSVGVMTGVFGVLAAHELVHGDSRIGHLFGTAMLSGMCYRHFRISHVLGHHQLAATEDDPATARQGEGFYHFFLRTLAGQYRDAWRIERTRLKVQRLRGWHNRLSADAAATILVFLTIFHFASWRGVAFFAAQCAVAIMVLELFNYIAHYGLLRSSDRNGRQPFGPAHSWNSSNVLANALIFNMGRHTHHHARPFAPYQSLRHAVAAPELPLGYAGSILLALVPPVWHRIMDPAVQRLHTRSSNESA